MKAKRFISILLVLLLLLLVGHELHDSYERKRAEEHALFEEQRALLASLTNMDGTGEIHIHMSRDEFEHKLIGLNIPYDGYDDLSRAGSGLQNFYRFGDSLEKKYPEEGISSDDGLAEIFLRRTKEGLRHMDSVKKAKQLYPDYKFLEVLAYPERPYYIHASGAPGGWFIKEFWQPNGDLIVSAIQVSGPNPEENRFHGVSIKYLPASVAKEQDWWPDDEEESP